MRILKEQEKDEEDFLGSNSTPKSSSHIKRHKKRRAHKRSDDDEEFDPYWAHINQTNLSMSIFNNDGQQIIIKQSEPFSGSADFKVSRDDKKLQYYLDMIARQERAESRKRARKQNKSEKSTKGELKNSKNKKSEITDKEPEVPIKFSLVEGTDPEMDILAKFFQENMWKSNDEYNIVGLTPSDLHESDKYNKDDNISWSQSEDQNESTFDKLRTPTQNISKTSLTRGLHDDIIGFENIRISSLYDKVSRTPGELDLTQNSESNLSRTLKDDFWNRLMRLTKQKQARLKSIYCSNQVTDHIDNDGLKVPAPRIKHKSKLVAYKLPVKPCFDYNSEVRPTETINEDALNISPIVSEPIFKIYRKRRAHYRSLAKLHGSSSSTEYSNWGEGDDKASKATIQSKQVEEAVMLIS